MYSHNDAWFMNESLAFYMSTNTFSNPIFDTQLEQDAIVDKPEGDELENVTTLRRNETNATTKETSEGKQGRWTALRDGLAFSVKSKMYVLELNFKRELRRLRRFAGEHLPFWLLPNGYRNPISGLDKAAYSWEQGTSCIEDKFWKQVEKPSSRKALGVQQEKILYRLEKVLRAIRNEQQQQQQQQQQRPVYEREELDEPQLFNMSGGVSSRDGRGSMEFVGQPLILHKSKMMCSGLTSLSSASSSSLCSQSSQSGRKLNGSVPLRANKRKSRWISKGAALTGRRRVEQEENSGSNKKLCIVCYTNPPNIVTLPCKHHDTCSDCFIELIYMAVKRSQYPLKCVLCRQKIERIRCSRRLLLSVIEKNLIRP